MLIHFHIKNARANSKATDGGNDDDVHSDSGEVLARRGSRSAKVCVCVAHLHRAQPRVVDNYGTNAAMLLLAAGGDAGDRVAAAAAVCYLHASRDDRPQHRAHANRARSDHR